MTEAANAVRVNHASNHMADVFSLIKTNGFQLPGAWQPITTMPCDQVHPK